MASPTKKSVESSNESKPVAKKATARVYKGTQTVEHDLFKLKVATMKKNVSYTDIPHYERIEHCHIFHTFDSNGKKQEACSAVGGHFHLVQVTEGEGVPTLEVSPPMVWGRQKIQGRFQRVMVPLEDDDHTHDVEYLGSQKIKLRETNMEFAKFESALHAKQNPSIEGVQGT